ncbi:F390 synthetase-related protein [Ruania zhangjianzhongii]|uniref:F390 synthetase-related protein n=1 Tax=Ruania zhangjianzhongii TaxID=2603206 RepID=UPI0011CB81A8|nr:F390 synthetase-related protein [Ruania zhangjianzhongii]
MSKLRTAVVLAKTRWGPRPRTRAALERYQQRRIRKHLRFLRARSPFYAHVYALTDAPVMDKAMMMAHFDRLNTVGVRRTDAEALALAAERSRDFAPMLDTIAVGLSSGTSGHRGLFLVSPADRDAWAGTVLAQTLPPGLTGHRIALFLRANNALYETVRSKLVDFRYYDLTVPITQHLADLAAYAPTILVAPPSVLRLLADAGHELGDLQRVYSVAEVLDPGEAETFATAFGQERLHQLYQCTEGFLAHTCARGVLHLNEQQVLIEPEWLDEDRFVPVVTDFSRRTQPIVRYRLNDVLVARRGRCACGSVLRAIERIEGRADDTLLLGGAVVFADLVSRAVIAADGFTEYRVVQTGPANLEVHLDDLSAAPAVRAELDALWQRLGIVAPSTEFLPYAADPAVKRRRVRRDWQGAEDAAV